MDLEDLDTIIRCIIGVEFTRKDAIKFVIDKFGVKDEDMRCDPGCECRCLSDYFNEKTFKHDGVDIKVFIDSVDCNCTYTNDKHCKDCASLKSPKAIIGVPLDTKRIDSMPDGEFRHVQHDIDIVEAVNIVKDLFGLDTHPKFYSGATTYG